ncbi:MAG TPA: hypothetical protein VHI13_00020, partial [Candidatus Kapabacteria bacterium]|nr:hypothetical protein [Candidatus Kapabacteria bacterium]
RVRICFDRPATRRSLTITDIAGHSILASDATAEADGCVSLDVSSLAPGLYLVGSGAAHGTFVIVR